MLKIVITAFIVCELGALVGIVYTLKNRGVRPWDVIKNNLPFKRKATIPFMNDDFEEEPEGDQYN